MFGGVRVGWDFDQACGTEMRFAVALIGLYDSQRAKDSQSLADTQAGYALDDPYRQRYNAQLQRERAAVGPEPAGLPLGRPSLAALSSGRIRDLCDRFRSIDWAYTVTLSSSACPWGPASSITAPTPWRCGST